MCSSRDHCILGQTFNPLSPPPFLIHMSTKNIFFFIIQTIQLWHLLTNSLFHINKQFFCICYKKHLKWGDEVSIREFLRLCSALWFVWVREREREERERERASSFYKSSIWVRGQQASISLFWNVCINFLPRNGVSNWKQKLFLLLLFRGDNLKNRFRTNFWKSWSYFGANLRSENF